MTYIIAEAGINHNGNIDLAARLVDAAAEAEANAVKFQLFHINRLSQYQLSEKQIEMLLGYCQTSKITFLCTPFDKESVDFLTPLVNQFKIGSGQSNDQDFVEYVASKGKPILLSTGMSSFADVRHSVANVEVPVTLLHCVSLYPTPAEKADLKRMQEMMLHFTYPVGYSDHTEGIDIALASVALGAKVIEKHLTLDKSMEGPDHKASITPEELKALVKCARRVKSSVS